MASERKEVSVLCFLCLAPSKLGGGRLIIAQAGSLVTIHSPLGAFMVAVMGFCIICWAIRISSCSIESSARNSLSGRRIRVFTPGKLGRLGRFARPFCL